MRLGGCNGRSRSPDRRCGSVLYPAGRYFPGAVYARRLRRAAARLAGDGQGALPPAVADDCAGRAGLRRAVRPPQRFLPAPQPHARLRAVRQADAGPSADGRLHFRRGGHGPAFQPQNDADCAEADRHAAESLRPPHGRHQRGKRAAGRRVAAGGSGRESAALFLQNDPCGRTGIQGNNRDGRDRALPYHEGAARQQSPPEGYPAPHQDLSRRIVRPALLAGAAARPHDGARRGRAYPAAHGAVSVESV